MAPSAYDDEFETGLLDPKWTAINCATGTVDLLSVAAAADTYDATTYQGMMALQPGRDAGGAGAEEAQAAILRQAVTLAANCKVILKLNTQGTLDVAAASTVSAGLLLSGINGFDDNNFVHLFVMPDFAAGATVPALPNFAIGGTVVTGGAPVGFGFSAAARFDYYLMILKTGNDYSFWTGDGRSWGALTDASAPDNIRFANANALTRLTLYSYWAPGAAEVNLPNPISTFDFVRYFTNNTPLVNA